MGAKFSVRTDQSALRWLLSVKEREGLSQGPNHQQFDPDMLIRQCHAGQLGGHLGTDRMVHLLVLAREDTGLGKDERMWGLLG